MDESNIDTQEAAWITSRNRVEANVNIILRSPFEQYFRKIQTLFPTL